MSNAIFPTVPGLAWDNSMSPEFKTSIHRGVSGRELRGSFQQFPLWTMVLTYEFLRDMAAKPELGTLVGFFLARQGAFDSFLYTHPADCSVVDMNFGEGDGVTTQFQLSRAYGASGNTFAEPVQNANVVAAVKANGTAAVLTTDYSVSATGMVVFTTAPAAGALLTWTGTYYYRVRFVKDALEFGQFMKDLWEAKKIELIGAVGNKV